MRGPMDREGLSLRGSPPVVPQGPSGPLDSRLHFSPRLSATLSIYGTEWSSGLPAGPHEGHLGAQGSWLAPSGR